MVEWKKLEEIVKRNKGIPITAGQMSELNSPNGNVRVFAAGQTIADIDEDQLPKGCAYTKPSVVVKSRGYIDFEFYDKPFTHKSEMWSYSFEDINLCKYVYYYLTTKTEEFRKKAKTNSVKLPQLCVSDTDKYQIPIPSLSERNRIVGILDTFTDSIENLKQQIAQRRKQYEFYRDQLLDLEGKEGVEMKTLRDFAFTKVGPFGSLIHKEDYICGGVPLVNPVHMINGKVMKDDSFTISEEQASTLNNYKLKVNDILFARRGEIGRCAIITEKEENYICGTGSLIVRFKDKLNSKYMLYIFSSPYCKRYLEKSAIGGTMLNINCGIVEKMIIPIPSYEEQSRIVSILDTFEASISNLEAQLAQRQKQYEYYRNKLLTFE